MHHLSVISRNAEKYALINRDRGPYEKIFVLTFKAHGPNTVSLCTICLSANQIKEFVPYLNHYRIKIIIYGMLAIKSNYFGPLIP